MLTYSRAKGLFVGIDLGGSWVERDKDSTTALYGKDMTNHAILDGEVHAHPEQADECRWCDFANACRVETLVGIEKARSA